MCRSVAGLVTSTKGTIWMLRPLPSLVMVDEVVTHHVVPPVVTMGGVGDRGTQQVGTWNSSVLY